jgi:D-tagatose-1,6-bisphosphate aldolase subunit GatZ/KbaZ
VAAAFERLVHNLTTHPVPVSLLSQYLPRQAETVREGKLRNEPMQLIRHRILEAIDPYAFACGLCAPQRRQGAGA